MYDNQHNKHPATTHNNPLENSLRVRCTGYCSKCGSASQKTSFAKNMTIMLLVDTFFGASAETKHIGGHCTVSGTNHVLSTRYLHYKFDSNTSLSSFIESENITPQHNVIAIREEFSVANFAQECVIQISNNHPQSTLIFHFLSYSDKQDRAIFNTLPKPWMLARVNIGDSSQELEPHVIAIHKRGSFHHVYGEERGAVLFRIAEQVLEAFFFTPEGR